jgi:hypothetical protein
MRALRVILGLMALCGGTIQDQGPLEAYFRAARKSDAYRAAYKQGRAEADREIQDQVATIYTSGLRENLFDNLDKETGLPYCGFGCVVDYEILGRIDGHNDRITEYIKANGLPRGSFKPWEKELAGLQEYCNSRRKHEQAEILMAGGPTLNSPDGNYTLKPVAKQDEKMDELLKTLGSSDAKVRNRLAIEVTKQVDKLILTFCTQPAHQTL